MTKYFVKNNITVLECVQISALLVSINDWTLYTGTRLLFAIIYGAIFLAGMVGNCGIMCSILRRQRVNIVGNLFLINLAVSDVLLCITSVPVAPFASILKRWYLGSFMCGFIPLCQGTSVLITSLSLTYIAVDRYRNIMRISRDPWRVSSALLLICGSWVVAVTLNTPYFLSQRLVMLPAGGNRSLCGLFCGEFGWQKNLHKRLYGSAMLSIQFLVPCTLMGFCYSKLLIKVQRDMCISAVAGATQRTLAAARKRRTMMILVFMVVAFVASWLPLTLVNILRDFNVDLFYLEVQPYFSQLTVHSVAMASVVWNPLLYFWMSWGRKRGLSTRSRRTTDFEMNDRRSTIRSTFGGAFSRRAQTRNFNPTTVDDNIET